MCVVGKRKFGNSDIIYTCIIILTGFGGWAVDYDGDTDTKNVIITTLHNYKKCCSWYMYYDDPKIIDSR